MPPGATGSRVASRSTKVRSRPRRRGPRPGRGAGPRRRERHRREPARLGERFADPVGGDVGVGVRDVERDVPDDEVGDAGTLRARRSDAVHAAQQQRVVGEQQVGAEVTGLLDDGERRVDRGCTRRTGCSGSPVTRPTRSQDCAVDGRVEVSTTSSTSPRVRSSTRSCGPGRIEPTTFAV